jgi:hypothetical protein
MSNYVIAKSPSLLTSSATPQASASHGDIDYSDVEDSTNLHSNLTHMGSTEESVPTSTRRKYARNLSNGGSDSTLPVGEGPFNFEKGLRSFIKK